MTDKVLCEAWAIIMPRGMVYEIVQAESAGGAIRGCKRFALAGPGLWAELSSQGWRLVRVKVVEVDDAPR